MDFLKFGTNDQPRYEGKIYNPEVFGIVDVPQEKPSDTPIILAKKLAGRNRNDSSSSERLKNWR